MARRKLKHFEEMKKWPHVLEFPWGTKPQTKGTWGKPLILELGCGGGNYTLGLAQHFPEKTVVGVDIKGARMWWGAGKALELGLPNVRFLRAHIEDLADFFEEGEVDELWITFPEPHPTKGNAKRRLTAPRFLEIYGRILRPGGKLHLKTDDVGLFEYSLEVLGRAGFEVERVVPDVYGEPGHEMLREIQTLYEKKYLAEGKTIRYLCVSRA